MRLEVRTCEFCSTHSKPDLSENLERVAGWTTHHGRDICPSCAWDIECGQQPGDRTHTTVRPLPVRTRTQRPSGEAA